MMLTREQAAATWCPMVRGARHEVVHNETPLSGGWNAVSDENHVVGGCNTDALGRNRVPASCRCIADQCAMWRWGEADQRWVIKIVDDPEKGPGHKREVNTLVDEPIRGYCGLAGAPVIVGGGL